jgi:hypothetical protein
MPFGMSHYCCFQLQQLSGASDAAAPNDLHGLLPYISSARLLQLQASGFMFLALAVPLTPQCHGRMLRNGAVKRARVLVWGQ